MTNILSSQILAKHLSQRGLVPENCRLVEVTIPPNSALVIRYEVFVDGPKLSAFAEAMTAAAAEAMADDERNRLARAQEKP